MYKKISYLLTAALALGFVACSDQNEVVDELYKEIAEKPVVKHIEYTLSEADYATISAAAKTAAGEDASKLALAAAVASTNSLNEFATAGDFVPPIIANAFPALKGASTVQVTFNYSENLPEYLSILAGAGTYTLKAADYASVWGEDAGVAYLTPAKSPKDNIPAILKTALPEAVSGDVLIAAYKYSDLEPNLTTEEDGPVEVFGETFDDKGYANKDKWEGNGWTQVITQGTKQWEVRSYNNNFYGQMSANGGADEISESYVISPEIDLSSTTDNVLSFSATVGYWNYNCLSVLVTEDPAALTTPATVVWNDVTAGFALPEEPASGYGTSPSVGEVSLKQYDGKKIYIAFKYYGEKGTGNTWTSTYQIDNIYVGTSAATDSETLAASSIITTPVDQKAIYTYNGSAWSEYPDAIVLSPADYTAMGSNYGNLEPDQATELLPQFLAHNVEYSSEGDKVAVVYVRYEGSATTVADEYVYTGGVWTLANVPVVMTEQAKYEADRGWWFDPTITFTMTATDYQILVTSVLSNPATSMYTRGTYTNEEWYYGSNAYYVNFSFRLLGDTPSSSRQGVPSSVANDTELHALDGNTEAQAALLWKRLEEKGIPQFLAAKYPMARVEVSGIEVLYNVGTAVFYPDGVTNTTLYYIMTYKVATAGAPGVAPTFTFIEKKEVSKNELP
jgi:hypothetical protein